MNPDPSLSMTLLASLVLALTGVIAFAEPSTQPSTRPASNGWDASFYNYKKLAPLVVEEATPTPALIDWKQQPPKLPANVPAPKAATARPLTVNDLTITHLRFRDLDNADVPALLVTPAGRQGPFPVVVALHGLRSNKAQVVAQVAPGLTRLGFAVLAPDLPLHGERPGDPNTMFDQKDLRAFVARVRQSIFDVRLCIDLAESRPELDTRAGVVLVGYSMGAIFESVAGPADPRVKAMCLMVGGTVDFPPMFAAVPQLAALQPQLAISHFAGRPLLMLNATADKIISKEMADRLYAAAPDPKQQVWYDSGHRLPAEAYAKCAQWVGDQWQRIQAAK